VPAERLRPRHEVALTIGRDEMSGVRAREHVGTPGGTHVVVAVLSRPSRIDFGPEATEVVRRKQLLRIEAGIAQVRGAVGLGKLDALDQRVNVIGAVESECREIDAIQ